MKRCFFKVYKNLSLYSKSELNILSFKICFIKKKKQMFPLKKRSYQKSFCFFTGVKKSVYTFFDLARWNLKFLLSASKINGLKRISW